jgi:hypothetical protein
MIIATLGGLMERLDWSTILWGGLWTGLVAFTLGLSFLLWTRWGYYHLTGKCVLFSLLAHMLIGVFFSTAEVVEDVVVAMNSPANDPPITIERVRVIKSDDDSKSNSNIDGREDESAAGVWDRATDKVAIDSPMLVGDAPEMRESPLPPRPTVAESTALPKETPKPQVPVAVVEPGDPALKRSTPEAPERVDVPATPAESVASAAEAKAEVLPQGIATKSAPAFASQPTARVKVPDASDTAREAPGSGTDASRVMPNTPIASSASVPEGLARPIRSPLRPGAVAGSDTLPSTPSGPITSPEPIAGTAGANQSGAGAGSTAPSTSVRIGLPTGTATGKGDTAPRRSGSDDGGEGINLPRPAIASSSGGTPVPGSVASGSPGPSAVRPIGPMGGTGSATDRPGGRLGTPEIYRERMNPNRSDQAVKRGGSRASEEAVARALEWLAAHQQPDGHWDVDGFQALCPPGKVCSGTGSQNRDDGAVTGLVLLTFLGAGNTHWDGKHSTNVLNGLNWLLNQIKPNGDLRGTGRMYSHGIATLALSEAYGMSGDDKLRDPVERAVKFIVAAQHPSSGGWRYLPGQYGDTSIFGWQLMALKSASLAGIEVPDATWQKARTWLQLVGSGRHRGLAAYQPDQQATPPMTAEALACRVFLGESADSPALREAADNLMQYLPQWHRENLYYWYYGTVACFQMGGDYWQRWNNSLRDILIEHQARDGHAAGSWDPNPTLDTWGKEGGRVYSTALATLCLEVYYRFLPIQSLTTGEPPNQGPSNVRPAGN